MNRLALPAVVLALVAMVAWMLLSPDKNSSKQQANTIDDGHPQLHEIGYSEQELEQIEADQRRRELEREKISSEDLRSSAPELDYGKASFVGKVVNPENEPLAEAIVKMAVSHKWQYSFDPKDENLITIWTASTNSDGEFYFPPADFPQADYLLQIVTADFPVKQIENLKANVGYSRDLGIIRLSEPATVSGKIVDENNSAIVNAEVLCFIALDRGRSQIIEFDAPLISDANGNFTTGALPARDIFLQASRENYASEISPQIKLRAGEEFADLTIMLPATQSIIGKVVDEVNQPVFEAAISQTQSSTHRSIKNSVTSDGNGDFEIKIDAKSTQAKLTIEATGYRLQELILKDLSESPTVVLRKIPTLTGVVRDSNKRPVGGATIVLANRSISKEKIGRAIKVEQCNGFATSDANGEFDIIPTNIEDGKELMQLVAFDNDHPPTAYFRSISFSDARKRKPTYKDIVIDMKPGQVISGEVLNNSKVAVDNAQVMLRRLAKPRQSRLPSPDLRRDGTILDQVVVGADGKFVFANQESGDYRLEIYHPDYSPTQSDDFTLRDSAYQCQLIMGAPGGIRGQVKGEIHKFPNLVVQASSPGMELVQVRVDLEGNYEFLNLMPGNYSLEVHDVLSANQGKWWQVAQQPLATADSIEVSPGNYQSQDLTINNSEFASIAGKVTVNGEAAISYSVFAIPHVLGVAGTDQRMVMREKIMYAREARTNPDGSYEISGIVPNNYWVIVAEPGIRRWMLDSNQPTGLAVQDLALNSAQQHQANFSILTGSVKSFSQGGKNLQGRSITLKPVPADGRQSQAVYVFSNRENVVSGIPEGSYEFTTNKNQAAQRVFVAAGGVTDIQVNLQPRRRSNR